MPKISGGGITSNKLVTSKGYKTEPVANKASPAGAGQLGAAVQFRKEPLIQGPGYNPPGVPATGVPGKYNAALQGPGSQRTICRSGGQSQYGSPAPSAVNRAPDRSATGNRGRDILSDFGPERDRR